MFLVHGRSIFILFISTACLQPTDPTTRKILASAVPTLTLHYCPRSPLIGRKSSSVYSSTALPYPKRTRCDFNCEIFLSLRTPLPQPQTNLYELNILTKILFYAYRSDNAFSQTILVFLSKYTIKKI